jgi:undecaprenyl-diphosphatase
MILLDELIRLDVSSEFYEMFLVVIQLGAILAVPILFYKRLNPFVKDAEERRTKIGLWGKVLVGSLPAAILGFLLDDLLDRYLYNYVVVALSLIVYGVFFIFVEKSRAEKKTNIETVEALGYTNAIGIGVFQALSLIPGTSRSGSTILGGMLIGASRNASAEFSFFMAIPVMLGASLLRGGKLIASGVGMAAGEWCLLGIGSVTAFLVSLLVIRSLLHFVKRHSFKVFGVYRIILGILILFCLRN